MSTLRACGTLALAAALTQGATAAFAQTAPTPANMPAMAGMPAPVMDDRLTAHVLFDQLEGRNSGSNTAFRWDGRAGSAPITISSGSNPRASYGAMARSMTAATSFSTTARSQLISICKVASAPIPIPVRRAIGRP
jgi:hypothetical protein